MCSSGNRRDVGGPELFYAAGQSVKNASIRPGGEEEKYKKYLRVIPAYR